MEKPIEFGSYIHGLRKEKKYSLKIVADKFEDKILFIPQLSKDKIHPTTNGYKELANNAR